MIRNLKNGLGYFKKGLLFFRKNRSLYKFGLIPFLINIILFLVVGWVLIKYYSPLFNRIISTLGLQFNVAGSNAMTAQVVSWVFWLLQGFLQVLLGIVLLVLFLVGMLFVSQIINSPFYELLSYKTEKLYIKFLDPSFEEVKEPFSLKKSIRDIFWGIWLEIKKFIFFLVIPLILLIINFIPVIGPLLYTFLSNTFAAFSLGFNYFSYPFTRKGVLFRRQVLLGLNHRAKLVGFGLPLLVPFFNILFAPLFVVGGTMLAVDLERNQPEKIQ